MTPLVSQFEDVMQYIDKSVVREEIDDLHYFFACLSKCVRKLAQYQRVGIKLSQWNIWRI